MRVDQKWLTMAMAIGLAVVTIAYALDSYERHRRLDALQARIDQFVSSPAISSTSCTTRRRSLASLILVNALTSASPSVDDRNSET
jgi:hypothetical protein